MGTFPNEIVTFQLPDGTRRRVFCKYGDGEEHPAYGHRGGLAYEAEVYHRMLRPLAGFRPRLLGAHRNGDGHQTWLILEFLERCTLLRDLELRLHGVSQATAMLLAARWLGQFHSAQEARLRRRPVGFLHKYDSDYYAGWARRTRELTAPRQARHPWLAALCRQGASPFEPLLTAPQTLIHGEFYVNNILVRQNDVFPVDWESAAVAPGEIDLAALTEGPWRAELVRQCVQEYQRTRWPEGPPPQFSNTFDTARLYLHFRWLGERQDWTLHERNRWRFNQLRLVAQRLGLI